MFHFFFDSQVKPSTVGTLSKFKNDLILPILWMEMTSGEVPEEFRAVIYHSTFSANAIQLGLRYGSLLGLIVSTIMLITGFYLRNNENEADNALDASFKATGTLTIEELVTIDLNDPAKNDTTG